MPIIYLSPSTQDWNHFVNGGTEEYYMNLIADAMEPYLLSSGIRWVRNTPDMTAASSRRFTPTPGWSRRSRPPGSARSPRRARPAC